MKNNKSKKVVVKIAGKSNLTCGNSGLHKGGRHDFSYKYGKPLSPVGGGGHGRPKSIKEREYVVIVQGGGMGKPMEIKKIMKYIKK